MTLRHQSCESSGGLESLPYSGWLVFHFRNAGNMILRVSEDLKGIQTRCWRLTLPECAPELVLVDIHSLRSRHPRLHTAP
jgi:hypothetical protein